MGRGLFAPGLADQTKVHQASGFEPGDQLLLAKQQGRCMGELALAQQSKFLQKKRIAQLRQRLGLVAAGIEASKPAQALRLQSVAYIGAEQGPIEGFC